MRKLFLVLTAYVAPFLGLLLFFTLVVIALVNHSLIAPRPAELLIGLALALCAIGYAASLRRSR